MDVSLYLQLFVYCDEYRNGDPRSEKKLDWSLWDKAAEFWALLAAVPPKGAKPKEGNRRLQAVIDALAALANPQTGRGATESEKLGVIAKAWKLHAEDAKIVKQSLWSSDDSPLEHILDENGELRLSEFPDFGGIDVGMEPEEDDEVTREEVEKTKEQIKLERQRELLSNKFSDRGKAPEEVKKVPPVNYGKDGKPPPLKALPKPLNKREDVPPRKQTKVEREQTERARKADELLANRVKVKKLLV